MPTEFFIKGNVDGNPPPPGDGDNGENGGRGGNDDHNRNSRLQNFIDHSGEMVAAGAGAIATVALPVREVLQFESAMADVKKVVDQTDEEFQQMGADIQDMSLEFPMKQGELAAIIAAGGQSGIENENLLPFAKSAAKMGVAFDIEADQAGEMMAQWRTAFNMNQSDVIDLADKVNYLGNTTAASASKISKVLTYIGALGEVAGIHSGEIAALGASIVGVGVAPEVASTAIKNLMPALVAGEGATTA